MRVGEFLAHLRHQATFPYQGAGRNGKGLTPCCILQHTPNMTAANNTSYILGTDAPFNAAFATEVYDSDGMHDSAFVGRIYCRTPGIYDAKWGLVWAASTAAGGRLARLLKNGAVVGPDSEATGEEIDANFSVTCRGDTTVRLAAGDYLEVLAYQLSGGNLNVNDAWLNATLIANV